MTARVSWTGGGEATLVTISALQVTFQSNKPFPPGAPVAGTLHLDDGTREFGLKVVGSRKSADTMWEVRGRLVTATSELLAAFGRAVG